MDIWGVGCVFFEVLSLFPLFPGNDELDQVHKIHNILGTPPKEVLDRFQKYASHMDFNFPQKEGTGIAQLIPHVSSDCQELIIKLLAYNPDERPTAKQALNHPYFKDLRSQEKKVPPPAPGPAMALSSSLSEDSTGKDAPEPSQPRHVQNPKMAVTEMANDGIMKTTKRAQQGSKKITELKGIQIVEMPKHNTSADLEDQGIIGSSAVLYKKSLNFFSCRR